MQKRKFSDLQLFGIAMIPLLSLFAILGYSIIELGLDPHIPLLLSAFVAGVVAMVILGYSWKELQQGISDSIGISLGAILILMIIGVVIGTWIVSGVVPGLIYYGLNVISPKFFLVSALILSAIISLATGSSWTAAGTIGIALIGIATALDYHIGWTAGAVVSGAYFGDKMSPLSDTTNLAPAVAGTDIFKHIRSMLYTTVPAFIIALVAYTIIGLVLAGNNEIDLSQVENTKLVIGETFNIGLWIFIPPVAVITMIILKVDALPALFVSALIGLVMAIGINGVSLGDTLGIMHYGYESDSQAVLEDIGYDEAEYTTNEDGEEVLASLANSEGEVIDGSVISNVDELLSRGGLDSMLWTVSLIICAMVFGGIMEAAGLLQAVVNMILKVTFNYTALVTASIMTSVFVNVVAADQYLAIVLPGKMYRKAFVEDYKVKPYSFSRVLETGGTLTSPLVPWNTCGATMSTFLGVPVWGAGGYAMYTLFNMLNVVIEVIASAIGFGVFYADDKEQLKAELK